MKKALTYGTVLIVIYLLVANGTGAGNVINSATSGASNLVSTFQGR